MSKVYPTYNEPWQNRITQPTPLQAVNLGIEAVDALSAENRKLKERIDRLRFAVRKLDKDIRAEYGGDGQTDEQIEADDWLELQPGDMTE